MFIKFDDSDGGRREEEDVDNPLADDLLLHTAADFLDVKVDVKEELPAGLNYNHK